MKLFGISHIPGIKKESLTKIHWFLAEHAFSVILVLILASMLLAMSLFYRYDVAVEIKESRLIQAAPG